MWLPSSAPLATQQQLPSTPAATSTPGFDIRSLHCPPRPDSPSTPPSFAPGSHSATSSRCTPWSPSRMARSRVWVWAVVLALLLLTPSVAARPLRSDLEGRPLFFSVRRSMKSGDDAVPTAAKVDHESKYNEWVRFQAEQLTTDYPPAAANPSVPCCSP